MPEAGDQRLAVAQLDLRRSSLEERFAQVVGGATFADAMAGAS